MRASGELFDGDLLAGLGGEDELFEVGLVVEVGAEEDGGAGEDGLEDVVAADMSDKAASDDGECRQSGSTGAGSPSHR